MDPFTFDVGNLRKLVAAKVLADRELEMVAVSEAFDNNRLAAVAKHRAECLDFVNAELARLSNAAIEYVLHFDPGSLSQPLRPYE
jgi:hypothetical protein